MVGINYRCRSRRGSRGGRNNENEQGGASSWQAATQEESLPSDSLHQYNSLRFGSINFDELQRNSRGSDGDGARGQTGRPRKRNRRRRRRGRRGGRNSENEQGRASSWQDATQEQSLPNDSLRKSSQPIRPSFPPSTSLRFGSIDFQDVFQGENEQGGASSWQEATQEESLPNESLHQSNQLIRPSFPAATSLRFGSIDFRDVFQGENEQGGASSWQEATQEESLLNHSLHQSNQPTRHSFPHSTSLRFGSIDFQDVFQSENEQGGASSWLEAKQEEPQPNDSLYQSNQPSRPSFPPSTRLRLGSIDFQDVFQGENEQGGASSGQEATQEESLPNDSWHQSNHPTRPSFPPSTSFPFGSIDFQDDFQRSAFTSLLFGSTNRHSLIQRNSYFPSPVRPLPPSSGRRTPGLIGEGRARRLPPSPPNPESWTGFKSIFDFRAVLKEISDTACHEEANVFPYPGSSRRLCAPRSSSARRIAPFLHLARTTNYTAAEQVNLAPYVKRKISAPISSSEQVSLQREVEAVAAQAQAANIKHEEANIFPYPSSAYRPIGNRNHDLLPEKGRKTTVAPEYEGSSHFRRIQSADNINSRTQQAVLEGQVNRQDIAEQMGNQIDAQQSTTGECTGDYSDDV